MKSQAKVKQQRRIKKIPKYCDNPESKEMRTLNELVRKGVITITKPQPRRVEKTPVVRRMNRTSKG